MHVTIKIDRQLHTREAVRDMKKVLTQHIKQIAPGSSVTVLRDAQAGVYTAGLSEEQTQAIEAVVDDLLWVEGAEEDESDFEYEG